MELLNEQSALIVDDDRFVRELLSDILKNAGFNVTVAEDGEDALRKIDVIGGFDVIVSDINMPKMGGHALIRKIRSENPEVPIIVLTGNEDVSTALVAIKSGANDYLIKDQNVNDTVLLAVRKVLEKQRIIDENRELMARITLLNKEQEEIINRLTDIGTALSAEKDFPRLLEMIVSDGRMITKADAGTLYLLEDNKLHFKIVQNESMGIQMGGRSGSKIVFPPMELNESNVSGYVAMRGVSVNIPDVYHSNLFDFTGPKKYDASTGYRSRSMLVVPLKNHENDVVGVLQLMNAKDPKTGESVPFLAEAERLAESVASQAAVAVTNIVLIQDLEKLFNSFVHVMATAIDEKSPVTGGHIRRMANLTMLTAAVINEQKDGKYKNVHFSDEQMRVLNLASWMHDIGKVTTPVEIVEKGKKLQTIFDRIHFVDLRIRHVAKLFEIEKHRRKIELLGQGAPKDEILKLDDEMRSRLAELEDIRVFLNRCNEPGEFLEDQKVARLREIRNMTYRDENGEERCFLDDNELENLSIRKGSITEAERKKMQDHAAVTFNMLQKIPFTKKLRNIPLFAASHHEHINGKGYPLGLRGDAIPFEAKLMAVTDIVEALTAADRPYKKAMPMEIVYKILRSMAKDEQLDADLVEFFIEQKIYDRYKEQFEQPPAAS